MYFGLDNNEGEGVRVYEDKEFETVEQPLTRDETAELEALKRNLARAKSRLQEFKGRTMTEGINESVIGVYFSPDLKLPEGAKKEFRSVLEQSITFPVHVVDVKDKNDRNVDALVTVRGDKSKLDRVTTIRGGRGVRVLSMVVSNDPARYSGDADYVADITTITSGGPLDGFSGVLQKTIGRSQKTGTFLSKTKYMKDRERKESLAEMRSLRERLEYLESNTNQNVDRATGRTYRALGEVRKQIPIREAAPEAEDTAKIGEDESVVKGKSPELNFSEFDL